MKLAAAITKSAFADYICFVGLYRIQSARADFVIAAEEFIPRTLMVENRHEHSKASFSNFSPTATFRVMPFHFACYERCRRGANRTPTASFPDPKTRAVYIEMLMEQANWDVAQRGSLLALNLDIRYKPNTEYQTPNT